MCTCVRVYHAASAQTNIARQRAQHRKSQFIEPEERARDDALSVSVCVCVRVHTHMHTCRHAYTCCECVCTRRAHMHVCITLHTRKMHNTRFAVFARRMCVRFCTALFMHTHHRFCELRVYSMSYIVSYMAAHKQKPEHNIHTYTQTLQRGFIRLEQ